MAEKHENSERKFQVRDERKAGHHWADNEVLDLYGPRIGAFGYAVYMYICRHAGNRDGRCYRTQREIAAAFSISTDTVGRAIQKLADELLIGKEEIPGKPNVLLVLEVPKVTAHSGNHLPPTAATPNANSGNHLPLKTDGLPLTAAHLPLTAARNKEEKLIQDFTQDLKRGNPHAVRSQSQLDSWDLRRWQAEMKASEPQEGQHIADPDAHWRQRAKFAAFQAGLSPARIVELLKQHFPNDPNVDLIYQQPELFAEQSA